MKIKNLLNIFIALCITPCYLWGASTQNLGVNEKTTVLCFPINGATNPIVISRSGSYRLATNLVNNQIIIDADDVCLLCTGQSITNTVADAIVIKDHHSDIIIQGGEVNCDGPTGTHACIKIGDTVGDCFNILIHNMKLSWAGYGIYSNGSTGPLSNINLLFRDMTVFDCNTGIYANHNKNLRLKQVYLGSVYDEGVKSYASGIELTNIPTYTGTFADNTVEDCTITAHATGIHLYAQSNVKVNRCSVMDLYSLNLIGVTLAHGILAEWGYNNLISNCTVSNINAIGGPASPFAAGIYLHGEDASQVIGCDVNSMQFTGFIPPTNFRLYGMFFDHCGEGFSFFTTCAPRIVVKDNKVSNICSIVSGIRSVIAQFYVDTASTVTNTYLNNFAINTTPTPGGTSTGFSANIPWIRSASNTYGPPNIYPAYSCTPTIQLPCPEHFPWNWDIP